VTRGVELEGAVVVVTGASSGIGRATARRFASRGSHLVLVARAQGPLDEAAAHCRDKGVRALTVTGDVADPATAERVVDVAVREFGHLDVWVNVAAVMAYGIVEQVPPATQKRIIEVNLLGTMWAARAVLPEMKKHGRGVIVNVASLYGRVATPYVSGYASSKFGVLGFSQVLRQELRSFPGIDVSVVLPGSVDTPIFRHAANYTGHHIKPAPPVVSPSRVSRAIVACAERPRRQVTVGQSQRLVAIGKALLPKAYGAVTPSVMRAVAIGQAAERPNDGNVFEPQPSMDAVQGHWRRRLPRILAGGVVMAAGVGGWAKMRRGTSS
jgi:short-subunit dehydrogenase